MSDVLTEEKIKAASDTIDAFLDSLSSADEKSSGEHYRNTSDSCLMRKRKSAYRL